MNFSTAIESVLKQNRLLKVAVIALSIVSVSQAILNIKLLNKEALIVERTNGKEPKVLKASEDKRSKAEINEFIKKSLEARFNTVSDKIDLELINPKETEFKELEQKELEKKGLGQEILIGEIEIVKGGGFKVNSERILRHEKTKAILDFPLLIGLKTVSRTLSNPYGLILERVTPAPKEEEPTTKGP